MKRNVVVAAVLAAALLVIPLPAHGELLRLWSQHSLETKIVFEPEKVEVISHTFDLVLGGKTLRIEGRTSNFTDAYGNGPAPKDTKIPDFMDLTFPVPGAGWSQLKHDKYDKLPNSQIGGKLKIADGNTLVGGFIDRKGDTIEGFGVQVRTSKFQQGVDVVSRDKQLDFTGCTASSLRETVIFKVKKKSAVQLEVNLSDIFLGATVGKERQSVIEALALFGTGEEVGANVVDRQKLKFRRPDGKFAPKKTIMLWEMKGVLEEGTYWVQVQSVGGVSVGFKQKWPGP